MRGPASAGQVRSGAANGSLFGISNDDGPSPLAHAPALQAARPRAAMTRVAPTKPLILLMASLSPGLFDDIEGNFVHDQIWYLERRSLPR